MPYLELDGAKLYYEMHGAKPGTGPAIVFAHGIGGNHLSWWQQVPHFRDAYTCIVFDHRGFGLSSVAGAEPVGATFVDDLRALLDHLGVERTHIVAQSMGGWTGLGFALRYPERVDRLVMCGTHGGIKTEAITEAWAASRALVAALPAGVHPAAGERMWREQPALHFLYMEIAAQNPERTPQQMGAVMSAIGSTAPAALKLAAPTLFISPDEDIVIPPGVVERAAALVRGSQLKRMPLAGHSAYFERAKDCNTAIRSFVEARF